MTLDRRDILFFVGVSLCILAGLMVATWLPGTLSHVYIQARYGHSVFGERPHPEGLIQCVGLPHVGNGGLLFCQGDLIYHPWAYNTPIDDRDSLQELEAMKRMKRSQLIIEGNAAFNPEVKRMVFHATNINSVKLQRAAREHAYERLLADLTPEFARRATPR